MWPSCLYTKYETGGQLPFGLAQMETVCSAVLKDKKIQFAILKHIN